MGDPVTNGMYVTNLSCGLETWVNLSQEGTQTCASMGGTT